jgi:hypothetical protein
VNYHETLRDAVRLVDKLGLRYLWVDSLCIIQDDPNDKELEIAQMPLVYNQSTVTIITSCGLGVYQGFLQERSFTLPQGNGLASRHRSIMEKGA